MQSSSLPSFRSKTPVLFIPSQNSASCAEPTVYRQRAAHHTTASPPNVQVHTEEDEELHIRARSSFCLEPVSPRPFRSDSELSLPPTWKQHKRERKPPTRFTFSEKDVEASFRRAQKRPMSPISLTSKFIISLPRRLCDIEAKELETKAQTQDSPVRSQTQPLGNKDAGMSQPPVLCCCAGIARQTSFTL